MKQALALAASAAVVLSLAPAAHAEALSQRPTLALRCDTQSGTALQPRIAALLSSLKRFEIIHAGMPALVLTYGVENGETTSESEYNKYANKTITTWTHTLNGHVQILKTDTRSVLAEYPIDVSGSSTDSAGRAEQAAIQNFSDALIEHVRDTFKLEAQLIGREGRTVRLNLGESSGIKPGMQFEVIRYGERRADPTTGATLGLDSETVGKAVISRSFPNHAEAYLIKGFYNVKEADQLRETPRVGNTNVDVTGAAELVPLALTDGTGQTQSGLNLMPRLMLSASQLLPQVGIETGPFLAAGATGFGPASTALDLDAGWKASYEVLPEIVSIYGLGGLGLLGVSQKLTTPATTVDTGKSVDSSFGFGLNGFGGTGLRVSLFSGLSLFGEARYRLANRLDKWTYSDGEGDSKKTYDIPTSLLATPSLTWGGLSYQAGLSYVF